MIQISIKNGRDRFWQWDANLHLVIRGVPDTFHVHFVQEGHAEPLPVLPVKQADGSFLAPVPNILLQTAEEDISKDIAENAKTSVEATGQAIDAAERAEAATEMHAGVIALDAAGATVTLPDSAERPLRALTVDITATQRADGTINGWSGATVTACGKNRLDGSLRVNEWKSTGVTVQYDPEDDTYTLNGTVTANNDLYSIDHVLAVGAGADIALTVEYVSGSVTVGDGQNAVFYIGHSDDGKTRSNFLACHLRQENNSAAKKLQKQYAFRSWFFVSAGVTFDNYKVRIQVEIGDTATEYEPFRGATASVDFGRDVYGGRYDWRTGELTITHELADGAVVPLDTPEVVQLEPSALPSTLYPSTTVFADTGDVTLTYAADTKNYIDRRILELIGG